MINLLPPSQKEEISLLETLNLVLVLGMVITSFLISLSLLLLLVKINIEKEIALSEIFFKEKEKEAMESKKIREKIEKFNLEILTFTTFERKKTCVIEILEKISGNLPEKIYLTNFNLNWSEKDSLWQASLSGFSPDRESLLALKENLEKEEGFFQIYFPPENWIVPKNINFSLTFKIK